MNDHEASAPAPNRGKSWQPNAAVVARITCPRCGRDGVSVRRANFTIYSHQGFTENCFPCLGAEPEIVFTAMLREAGLDRRPDADTWPLATTDPEWERRQRQSDREARAHYYGGGGRNG